MYSNTQTDAEGLLSNKNMTIENKSLSQAAPLMKLYKNTKCSSERSFAILDTKQWVCCLYRSDVFVLIVVITE